MDYDDVYGTLMRVGLRFGFRPDVPEGMEEFVRAVVGDYKGSPEGFEEWFSKRATECYRVLEERPGWIQDPEWPVYNGKPMVFVGQLDFREGTEYLGRHSGTFFVFWDPEAPMLRTILQVD